MARMAWWRRLGRALAAGPVPWVNEQGQAIPGAAPGLQGEPDAGGGGRGDPGTIDPPDLGPGSVGAAARPARRGAEYLAGGEGYAFAGTVQVLDEAHDDAQRHFGDDLYEVMRNDAAVGGSLTLMKLGTLSGELTLRPATELDPDEAEAVERGEDDEDGDDEEDDAGPTRARPDPDLFDRAASAALAEEITEFCRHAIERLERPILPFLNEALDSLLYGDKLAEKVFEVEADEPRWAGYARYARLPVKPRRSWAYVVNPQRRVLGIYARTAPAGQAIVLPRDKFAILTYDARDGDPRGHSVARPAYKPWDIRSQLWGEYYRYLKRFAQPSVWGELPPDPEIRPDYAADGTPIPASGEAPADRFFAELEKFKGGSLIVTPHGAKVNLLWPQDGGDAFERGFNLCKQEIVYAILLQVRATLESQYGSRADSQTQQDLLGTVLLYLRAWVADYVRRELLFDLVALNWGPAVAKRLTPTVSLGRVEHQDVANLLGAFAKAGYTLADSHLPAVDAILNLPPRTQSEIAAKAEQARALAEAQAQPPPPPGADDAEAAGARARPVGFRAAPEPADDDEADDE